MKLSGEQFTNSQTCEGTAFSAEQAPLDIAEIKISGRYPEEGWAVNEEVHEIVYVSEGRGKLIVKDGAVQELNVGDGAYIAPGQKFAWQGEMTVIMSCHPPFNPDQYKVEEL